jgi:tripartite-type tricarboxylate transporter receptor subunit TctC
LSRMPMPVIDRHMGTINAADFCAWQEALLFFPALSRFACAKAYPSRPVRFTVGGLAGNPPDMFARLIGLWLSEWLGQPFVIDNRPGTGGNLAMEAVARSAPDGHTLLLVPTSAAINATLYDKLVSILSATLRRSQALSVCPPLSWFTRHSRPGPLTS